MKLFQYLTMNKWKNLYDIKLVKTLLQHRTVHVGEVQIFAIKKLHDNESVNAFLKHD